MVSKESRQDIRAKKHLKIRNRFNGTAERPRLAVFRSNNHVYAQVIDDSTRTTLVSFSSLSLETKTGDKKAIAKQVGIELGKLATAKEIKDVFFDRGSYLYHGRIKALAEGLRESGLNF